MPAITNDSMPTPPSSPEYRDRPRKSHDKLPIGNTFLYTTNGYLQHHNPQSDQFYPDLQHGSRNSSSIEGARSYSGDRSLPLPKTTEHPQRGSSLRRGNEEKANGTLGMEKTGPNGSVDGLPHVPSVANRNEYFPNGHSSTNAPPMANGDFQQMIRSDEMPAEPVAGHDHYHFSTSLPDSSSPLRISESDHDHLAPPPVRSHHRYSSPPAPSDLGFNPHIDHSGSKPAYRHTLQVPKPSNSRKNSRDYFDESRGFTTGRASPSAPNFRRNSLTLTRRQTRLGDLHTDEPLTDEDAARWAEAIKQRRARKKRREDEDDDRVIVGTKVDQNHVNWVTAYNMLTGIRFVVSRINAKMDRELTEADFQAKHKFSFDVTGNELTPSAKYDFKFKDYAPWVFRSLRAKFKLDPADYLMSLTSKYILSELGSPGKSGSFFYFSRDYKYIIKTIHHAEHKLLRAILPEYYRHIENNPNTLISQFYGLHRVKMAYGRKIHFVVMNNLFPPHRDIHEMFDLKGSTIGRDLREEDLEKNPRATMKDLNWLRRNRHIEEGPLKREVFMAQLRRDVGLLQRLKIMDYSLLIGIHDLNKGNEEKLRDKTLQIFQPGGEQEDGIPNLLTRTPSKLENARKVRELRLTLKRERPVPLEQTGAKMPDEILDERKNLVFYSDDGGFRATHENGMPGEEIYYLGVIDCLTHYGLVKKAEHFWKGLSHNRTQISPVPPEAYGERFLNFIEGITLSKEEAERQQRARETGEASQEFSRSSQGRRRSSVERTMQAAEKQVYPDPNEPRSRTVGAMRDMSDGYSASGPSTLPVVQEVGEANGAKKSPDLRETSPDHQYSEKR